VVLNPSQALSKLIKDSKSLLQVTSDWLCCLEPVSYSVQNISHEEDEERDAERKNKEAAKEEEEEEPFSIEDLINNDNVENDKNILFKLVPKN